MDLCFWSRTPCPGLDLENEGGGLFGFVVVVLGCVETCAADLLCCGCDGW